MYVLSRECVQVVLEHYSSWRRSPFDDTLERLEVHNHRGEQDNIDADNRQIATVCRIKIYEIKRGFGDQDNWDAKIAVDFDESAHLVSLVLWYFSG